MRYQLEEVPGARLTARTIKKMFDLAERAKRDPEFHQIVYKAVEHVPEKSYRQEARALYNFKNRLGIKYRRDPTNVELIRDWKALVKTGSGDCDDLSSLAVAAYETLGFPARLVTVAADPSRKDEFSHVYAEVNIPGEGWRCVDWAVPRFRFGQCVAPGRIFKKQVWNGDEGMAGMNGLGWSANLNPKNWSGWQADSMRPVLQNGRPASYGHPPEGPAVLARVEQPRPSKILTRTGIHVIPTYGGARAYPAGTDADYGPHPHYGPPDHVFMPRSEIEFTGKEPFAKFPQSAPTVSQEQDPVRQLFPRPAAPQGKEALVMDGLKGLGQEPKYYVSYEELEASKEAADTLQKTASKIGFETGVPVLDSVLNWGAEFLAKAIPLRAERKEREKQLALAQQELELGMKREQLRRLQAMGLTPTKAAVGIGTIAAVGGVAFLVLTAKRRAPRRRRRRRR